MWALETGGPDQAGVLWCGTFPGGLFRSDDHGARWTMVESLWRHPKRLEWMGGGADLPGLHSICVDPRDSNVVRVAVSIGRRLEDTPTAGPRGPTTIPACGRTTRPRKASSIPTDRTRIASCNRPRA